MFNFALKIIFLLSMFSFPKADAQQFGGSYGAQQVPQFSQLPAYNPKPAYQTNYGPQQQFQTGNYGTQVQQPNQVAASSYAPQQQFQGQQHPQAHTEVFQNTMFAAAATPATMFNMFDQPPPPIPIKPPPLVEPFYTFKEGTLPTYCSFGVNPVPVYTDPSKKCVPYHPGCGILFTCILNV